VLGAAKADTSLKEKVGNGNDRDNGSTRMKRMHASFARNLLDSCYRELFFS
jgi:hypothetical protein